MEKQDLIKLITNYTINSSYNYISREAAISEDLAGMRIFDNPLVGFASAGDENFNLLKSPEVIGEHFIHPKEWLPESKTVISIFFPFTEKVKTSNKKDMAWPSSEWLHGRIEGQDFIKKLLLYIKSELEHEGFKTMVPIMDQRFKCDEKEKFTSNWSERHIAFVCGLGTFGLSKGLITKNGVAGRFGSIITELEFQPDIREYKGIYEYCSMCGKCAENCPANAISLEKGKIHKPCSEFIDKTKEKFNPRYGCGKCQVNVPCESGIPKKRKNNIFI